MLLEEAERLGNRIKAAFMEWMAPENSSCRQIGAFGRAMLFQSADSINGAGWIKSARTRQYRRHERAINAN